TAQLEGCGGENAAGVAQGNHRIGFAFTHQLDGARDRAVLFLANRRRWFVLHRQHLARMDDPHAMVAKATMGQGGMDLVLMADPVGHVRGRALRTRAELRQGQHAVVRAAHALTAFGRFAFGDTHKLSELIELNRLTGLNGHWVTFLNAKVSVCLIPPRQPNRVQPGWCRCSVLPCQQTVSATRGIPARTADVAETPAEYLPAHKASSPRNH